MNGRQPEDDLAYPYFDDEEEGKPKNFHLLFGLPEN
jgi:hypothetical protein